MNEYDLIIDYKDNDELRTSFNLLAKETFGIDFGLWYQKGYWNDRYICYSYVKAKRVISNVSINIMDLILEAQKLRALQIGTVMTHRDYRNQGLSAKLLNHVLADYEDKNELIFLLPIKRC